jgi:hypothetical protein
VCSFGGCLLHLFLVPKMEAVYISETSISYRTTRTLISRYNTIRHVIAKNDLIYFLVTKLLFRKKNVPVFCAP